MLQGGGALGAYQAGVYAGLAETGEAPDWIAGVSIGAINAALMAGNSPERRVARLREFWERLSSQSPIIPPSLLDPMRPMFNRASAASAMAFGVPGFFSPRFPPPFMAPDGSTGALSYYDTEPLKATLEQLADFDLINQQHVRLSLGTVNVRTGNSVYFDNTKIEICPEHVLASGALPPGFPPVEIDGEIYWDGGIVSNTPLWYVLDEDPRMNALIFQVDVFSAAAEPPQNLAQVQERAKTSVFEQDALQHKPFEGARRPARLVASRPQETAESIVVRSRRAAAKRSQHARPRHPRAFHQPAQHALVGLQGL